MLSSLLAHTTKAETVKLKKQSFNCGKVDTRSTAGGFGEGAQELLGHVTHVGENDARQVADVYVCRALTLYLLALGAHYAAAEL